MNSIKFKTKTYFSIRGDFDPEDITSILKIRPYKQWKKGEQLRKESGKLHNVSFWMVGLIEKTNCLLVDEQMVETILMLKDKIESLKLIKEKYNVNFSLKIVPRFYKITPIDEVPVFSPPREIIEFCYLTNTDLDYSFYFTKDF